MSYFIDLPKDLAQKIRENISLDFLKFDKPLPNIEHSSGNTKNDDIRFMPVPVTNRQFSTFLNLIHERGLLEIRERDQSTDPRIFSVEKSIYYDVHYILKNRLFSKQVSPSLLVFERHHPNQGHTTTQGIVFDGNNFGSLSNYSDISASNISIFGALLFCQVFGCELPSELEWDYCISQVKIAKSNPSSFLNEEGELIEIPPAFGSFIEADKYYRLLNNKWSEQFNYSNQAEAVVWDWTKTQTSNAHYEDVRLGRTNPYGSHLVKAIGINENSPYSIESVAPSVPSYSKIEGLEHGFRCVFKGDK